MEMSEKVQWLLLGMAIGAVLGYFVRSLREIKEELEEVDDLVKKHQRDDRGAVTLEVVKNALLFVVVLATVWAAFASQRASNNVESQQDRIDNVTACNQEYLNRMLVAVNERTTYSVDQASANVELQKTQARYLSLVLKIPPLSEAQLMKALQDYFDALSNYLAIVSKTAGKAEQNPYPTPEQLKSCLDNGS